MITINSIANTNDKVNFRLEQCEADYGEECSLWEMDFKKMHNIVINKSKLKINKNDKSVYFITLKEVCKKWHFSSKTLKEFFLLSQSYEHRTISYHIFDHHPCTIDGSFKIDSQSYVFKINLGGSFEISDKNGKKFYFGCDYESNSKCEKYLP